MSYLGLTLFQLAGLALIGILGLQLLVGLFRQFRQTIIDRRWQNLALKQLELAEISIKQEQQILAHGWSGLRKFKVASKIMECEDICTFYLAPHDRQPIPAYKPGQHLTLTLQPHNQKKIIRCYSLSDCYGSENFYIITVKRLRGQGESPDGKGSGVMHQDIHIDDLIDIKAPKGGFFLNQKSQQPVILLGNGVGITPLLAMVNYLCEQQNDRPVILFYGVKNGKQLVQGKHLRKLAATHPAFSLVLCYSRPLENELLGQDYHYKGHVTSKLVLSHISDADAYTDLQAQEKFEFYICGSPPMMQENIAGLHIWKVPKEMINYEAFGAASIQKPAADKQADKNSSESYKIEFKQSGKTVNWDASQGTLLELCQNKSIPIDSGCCCGECGTCEIAIISGSVNYPNRKPETDVAQGHCLMCIASPTSPLILDA